MSLFYHKSHTQPSLFSTQRVKGFIDRLQNKKNTDEYLRLHEIINFEAYRLEIETCVTKCTKTKQRQAKGRPSFDPVFIFKALWLMHRIGMSKRQFHDAMLTDAVIQSALDIEYPDEVPSYQSLWLYDNYFAKTQLLKTLLDKQIQQLDDQGLLPERSDRVIDSTFYEVPRQHNKSEENRLIKVGQGQELWKENPNKRRHKDIDARWTKKRGINFFGYKGHISIDSENKFVVGCVVTSASVHDSQVITPLISQRDRGRRLYADAGYIGKAQEDAIIDSCMIPMICEKAFRNSPLTEQQKANNREKSKTRSRVEHAFGFIEGCMGKTKLHCVGIVRATHEILFDMLVYNGARLRQIIRKTQAT